MYSARKIIIKVNGPMRGREVQGGLRMGYQILVYLDLAHF